MTKPEQLLNAVIQLHTSGQHEFSQDLIRRHLELTQKQWHGGYSNFFYSMRIDASPKLSKNIQNKYQNIFEKECHGSYKLSHYGLELVQGENI